MPAGALILGALSAVAGGVWIIARPDRFLGMNLLLGGVLLILFGLIDWG